MPSFRSGSAPWVEAAVLALIASLVFIVLHHFFVSPVSFGDTHLRNVVLAAAATVALMSLAGEYSGAHAAWVEKNSDKYPR